LSFSQAGEFFGAENTLAAPTNRYVSVLKQSATDGETLAGYAQLIWRLQPGWELAAGARYTYETKDSNFLQPYVNPFFATLYAANEPLAARQRFHDASPEVTLTWQMDRTTTVYAAYKTGYKSGGFSNSADTVVNSAGVNDLTFKPETVNGIEAGLKATALPERLRLAFAVYRYRFNDLQVDYFNAQNFALITTNAGAALSAGAEAQAEYLPARLKGWKVRASAAFNIAHYQHYLGPCYAGETLAAGCDLLGPAPDRSPLQDLSGKPTADSPKWTGSLGADYERRVAGLLLGCSGELRFSSRYAVSPFAQPVAFQPAYTNVDAGLRVGSTDGRWQVTLTGKNLTNNFVVTYASDAPSTGSPPGLTTGHLADQIGLFAPPRTLELGLSYRH
jgi:outer membrane receptor protein involved in Fe transport